MGLLSDLRLPTLSPASWRTPDRPIIQRCVRVYERGDSKADLFLEKFPGDHVTAWVRPNRDVGQVLVLHAHLQRGRRGALEGGEEEEGGWRRREY